jgi:hypothetical protein
MSVQITLEGTLKADGTLELDQKVAMPEGRVLVTVQPLVQPAHDDPFWNLMETIWAGQRERGHVPRTKQQIDAELDHFRGDSEAEMQDVERLHEKCLSDRDAEGNSHEGDC